MMGGVYNYADKNGWSYVRITNNLLVPSYCQTIGWGRTRPAYFALQF